VKKAKASIVALQAMFDRLLSSFVHPLVAGGEVLVSYPIGPGAMHYFLQATPLDDKVVPTIVRARVEVLRDLLLTATARGLSAEELYLVAALHNVLLASHDDLSDGFRGGARWRHCLAWGLEQLSAVRPCESAETALARHSLLHQVTELTRRDILVTSRLGRRRFLGQDPPKSALVWPRLRKVQQSEQVVPLSRIVPDEDARRALSAVLEQSPLTCLVAWPYDDGVHTAALRFSPAVLAVLASPELCRSVTYRHLELGFGVVGRALAEALVRGVEKSASAGRGAPELSRLAFGLRYVINLQLTHCWTESDPEALVAPFNDPWGDGGDELKRLFFGCAAAALARHDRIGAPHPGDPELSERERRYQIEAADAAGSVLEDAKRQVDWLIPSAAGLLTA